MGQVTRKKEAAHSLISEIRKYRGEIQLVNMLTEMLIIVKKIAQNRMKINKMYPTRHRTTKHY